MRKINMQEVEKISGGLPHWAAFTIGAAAGSQIGRVSNIAVDHIIDRFQNPTFHRNLIHNGRAF